MPLARLRYIRATVIRIKLANRFFALADINAASALLVVVVLIVVFVFAEVICLLLLERWDQLTARYFHLEGVPCRWLQSVRVGRNTVLSGAYIHRGRG